MGLCPSEHEKLLAPQGNLLVPGDWLALFVSPENRNLSVNRHPGLIKCPFKGVSAYVGYLCEAENDLHWLLAMWLETWQSVCLYEVFVTKQILGYSVTCMMQIYITNDDSRIHCLPGESTE